MDSLESVAIEPDLIRRLTRREYHEMYRAGLFEDERVELLYGQLVVMSPTDPSHDESTATLDERLKAQLGGRARVRVQSSFAAADDSEPMPDIVVTPAGTYWTDHPSRAFLIVEVSRSSLRKDRGVKAKLYGEVAVDEYWIVDVDGGCVHVLRDPDRRGQWQSQTIARRGETLAVAAFPDVTIAVDDILPPIS
ncbi:MAG: Uma2 family endonuclease [Deltaproteobacteria bacterium]|nr:Uma2 family endonuclease [Kofleriaceae bacterium]